jgi:hypothetical protein
MLIWFVLTAATATYLQCSNNDRNKLSSFVFTNGQAKQRSKGTRKTTKYHQNFALILCPILYKFCYIFKTDFKANAIT